ALHTAGIDIGRQYLRRTLFGSQNGQHSRAASHVKYLFSRNGKFQQPGHHQPGGLVMTCSESHFRVDLNFKPKSGIGFVKRSPDPALVSDDDRTEITFPNLVPVFRFDQTEFVCEYTLLTRTRDFLNRSLEPAFRKMGLP